MPRLAAVRRVVIASLGVAAVAACTAARAPGSSEASRPPNASQRALERVARNRTCETCHEAIASEWRGSLHRASHSDPVYQRAFAREPLPFCTGCHAPEARAEDPGPTPSHALGVGCITCHDAPDRHPSAASRVSTKACGSCHDFAFPGSGEAMQLTEREHRSSIRAAVSCAFCHMPQTAPAGASGRESPGHASHRFDASRDEATIKSAAKITVLRAGTKLRFLFAPDRVGHAFPTGDLFRRLRLVAEVRGPGEPRRFEAFLGRKTKHADPIDERAVNHLDDRLFLNGQPSAVDVEVADASRPVAWRVVYERVEHPLSRDENDALIDGAIEVASGVLGPAPRLAPPPR